MSCPAKPAAVIVLAARAGTRMKSRTPKILHELGGLSMIGHALAAARGLQPQVLAAVVRYERDLVAEHISAMDPAAVIVDQDEVPGTGRAVEVAPGRWRSPMIRSRAPSWSPTAMFRCSLPRCSPSWSPRMSRAQCRHGPDRRARGRLRLRPDRPLADGTVTGIVEHKDATEAQRDIGEINSGIYAFDAAVLRDALRQVTTEQCPGRKVPYRRPGPGQRRRRPRRSRRHRRPLAGGGR